MRETRNRGGISARPQRSRRTEAAAGRHYLHHIGVGGHFEGYAGAEGQAHHADAVPHNLRVIPQEFEGFLQQKEGQEKSTRGNVHSYNPLTTPARTNENQQGPMRTNRDQ